jgi:hypothetical protein
MTVNSTRLITDHDAQGNSVFTDVVAESSHKLEVPFGTIEYLYSSPDVFLDTARAENLEYIKQSRISGLPNCQTTFWKEYDGMIRAIKKNMR